MPTIFCAENSTFYILHFSFPDDIAHADIIGIRLKCRKI
jgi:hypothetical protein